MLPLTPAEEEGRRWTRVKWKHAEISYERKVTERNRQCIHGSRGKKMKEIQLFI